MGNTSNTSNSSVLETQLSPEEIIKKSIKEKNSNIKCELNIYIYSNAENEIFNINNYKNINNPILNFKIMKLKGYSLENSNRLINIMKENNSKNVVIIPINSFSDFTNIIGPKNNKENEEKNILQHFQKNLDKNQQPFFMLVDFNENDFVKELVEEVEKNFVLSKYYELKRLGIDFEIVLSFKIKTKDKETIRFLKDILVKKKQNYDDFEIKINQKIVYKMFCGKEEIIELDKFFNNLEKEVIELLKIELILINQNSNFSEELLDYEKLEKEITEVTFINYNFKKDNLNSILKNYNRLDEKNFVVHRARKTPIHKLIQYNCFYNHFDDILYCEQNSYYPIKINLAIGGLKNSGKSDLINDIFGEKRCHKQYNSISQYTFKNFALSLILFPNTQNILNNMEGKIKEMENTNEMIHYFLFCINFKQPINENKEEIKKIINTLIKFELQTIFVITKSAEPNSKIFIDFKKNLIKILKEFKDKSKVQNIFGDDLEKRIIPVYNINNKKDNTIKSFGLNTIFELLFYYLYQKMVNENKEKDNELLVLFEKNKADVVNKRIKLKMELQAYNLIFKYIILNPDCIMNLSIDSVYKIYDFAYDNFLIFYKYIIDSFAEKEKLQIYNKYKEPRISKDEIKAIIENKEINEMMNRIKNSINKNYMISIHYVSCKLSELLVTKFSNKIKNDFNQKYYDRIKKTINRTILDLMKIKERI